MLPTKVLVASDGSESAIAAEKFAGDLACAVDACRITVVSVVRPSMGAAGARGGTTLWPPSEQELAAAKQGLADAVERVKGMCAGTKAEVSAVLLESTSPAKGIIDMAAEEGEGVMIVIGSRGHGGFGSLVLGSVSTQVLHGAHCPVVVVKG